MEKNASKIAITTNMWTSSNQKKGFMAITAPFVDDYWVMQSRIMRYICIINIEWSYTYLDCLYANKMLILVHTRFIYVPCPHTAEVLADVFYESLCDWNIDRKLSTVTVDNCNTNDAMIHNLLDKLTLNSLILGGELFQMCCCAHILNLIVQDGLSIIGDGIERIRDSVSFWVASPKRVEKFEEAARHLAVPSSKKLTLDCKTRRNFIKMFSNVLSNEMLIIKVCQQKKTGSWLLLFVRS